MRNQSRPVEPDMLKEKAAEWNERWKAKRSDNPKASFSWPQYKNRSCRDWILPVLREMNQGHCSFCDGFPLEGSSKEPIEHFRPKSNPEFLNLAFTWSNLYYCCEACQSEKGERWDERLLAPDAFGYDFYRYFFFDFISGEMLPNPLAAPDDQERASTTIDLYGLNEPSRVRMRKYWERLWQKSGSKNIDDFGHRNFIEGPL